MPSSSTIAADSRIALTGSNWCHVVGSRSPVVKVVEAIAGVWLEAAQDDEFGRTPNLDHLRVRPGLTPEGHALSGMLSEQRDDETLLRFGQHVIMQRAAGIRRIPEDRPRPS